MPMAAFDTMSVAKRLEREFDVPARQAEGFASVLHENFVGNVATKEDLSRTEERLGGEIAAGRKDVEHLEERLAGEIATVRKDVEHLEERLAGEIATVRKELGGEIATVRKELGGEIATVRKELGGEIATVRKELGGEIATVRKDMEHLEERLAARMDVQGSALKAEIARSVNRAVYTLGGLVTVLFILDRIVPLFGIAP